MNQSALDPASAHAGAIHHLFSTMLTVAAIVYIIVIGIFAVIVFKHRGDARDDAHSTALANNAVRFGLGGTGIILLALLLYDFSIARRLAASAPADAIAITVTGHRWWWEVTYEDTVPQRRVTLANEIHVPVGRAVRINLVSHDVIHSFWAPNLAGKKDLVPGHATHLWFRADTAGVYRGQCAEFCGVEHAKMAIMIVADPPAAFAQWLDHQRAPAVAATDSLASRGLAVFEGGNCSTCHAIRSTRAAGRVGPDLTHVASRLTLAAGLMPFTPGNLATWIANPQTLKPGVQMPVTRLSPDTLRALVAYLESLR
jgi:cytochrome c oxidase subunit 2